MSKLATTPIPLMPQHPDRDDLALSNDRDALCVCACYTSSRETKHRPPRYASFIWEATE